MKATLRSLLLALVLVLCLNAVPQWASVSAAPSQKTVVIAASDFQSYEEGPHLTCQTQVNEIFAQIKKDYSSADGFLFAGDYYHQYVNEESELGMQTLTQTVLDAGMGISPYNIVRAQGNHDQVGTFGFAPSGENDPSDNKYGVFVINEDDFMWFAGNQGQNGSYDVRKHQQTVQNTADRLAEYLAEKAEENFREPIFIVSHLPLHYSMRTYVYGDGRYAQYLIDELNYGASMGLNIVYLFGHNHSHNWDNHLGGAAIYLERGDTIAISNPSDPKDCYEETLGFTYLNAGYVGYFTTDNNEPVDRTMTMTVYEFGDGTLTIKRYDKNGLHSLKSAGVENLNRYNPGGRTEEQVGLVTRDTRVVASPQTVNLVTQVKEESMSTCQTAGNKGYYITSDGSCYADLGLSTLTTPSAQALPMGDHKYSYTDTGKGTHTAVCDYCKKTQTNLPHEYYSLSCEKCSARRTLTKVEAKEPTCSSAGNVAHYYHEQTNTYYEDRRGYTPLSAEQVILPPLEHAYQAGLAHSELGHWRVCSCGEKESLQAHSYSDGVCTVCKAEEPLSLVLIEAKDSTCTRAGNRAYYYDAKNQKYYKDEAAQIPTTPQEQALPLAQHRYGNDGLCQSCSHKNPDFVPATTTVIPSSAPASTAVPTTAVPTTVAPSTAATTTLSAAASSASASASVAAPTLSSAANSSLISEPQTSIDPIPYVCLGIFLLAAVGAVVFFVVWKRKK